MRHDAIAIAAGATATPGDTLYFVPASGRFVRPFRLARQETGRWPDDVRYIVADLVGLYDPDSCFASREAAEEYAGKLLTAHLRRAELEAESLRGAVPEYAELGGES